MQQQKDQYERVTGIAERHFPVKKDKQNYGRNGKGIFERPVYKIGSGGAGKNPEENKNADVGFQQPVLFKRFWGFKGWFRKEACNAKRHKSLTFVNL